MSVEFIHPYQNSPESKLVANIESIGLHYADLLLLVSSNLLFEGLKWLLFQQPTSLRIWNMQFVWDGSLIKTKVIVTFLVIFKARMNNLFMFKVKNLESNDHVGLLSLEWLSYFE